MRTAKHEKETGKKVHIRQGESEKRKGTHKKLSQPKPLEKRKRIPTKSLQNQTKLQSRENRPRFIDTAI
jgi:hypothetical protein